MPSFYDFTKLFTPTTIALNWKNSPTSSEQYYFQSLFTPWKKQGLELSWIKGSRGLPISLMPTAFDAQPTFRDRIGFALTETEMPFFREGYKIKERDRQELLKIRDLQDAYLNQVVDSIFDDYNELIVGARVVRERMASQILFGENGNAGISIKANGVDYTYNYDPDGTWKANNYFALSGTDLWTAKGTANPFNDIETAVDAVYQNTGTEPRIAVMNNTTFNTMIQTDAVMNRFKTLNPAVMTPVLTKPELRGLVERTLGITVVVYNKKYRDESKVAHSFVPDNYVALIPDGSALGRMAMGTTPEEADLRGKTDVSVALVDGGVAVTQVVKREPPIHVDTYASMIALPTFERMDECALIKVA